ncbi:uncharacterized protein LOC120146358 isoform X2 [Hibiscus syriacus]|uniref:uncharacterized protein LOC120146358 isoform X2 n=1 Tax=Hibiscus syriacus TaxID=106335 RepID=UPI0019218AAC|nr:uncharacterized protein LOC120146358 isoform X2 [Hibiscus syriacus]
MQGIGQKLCLSHADEYNLRSGIIKELHPAMVVTYSGSAQVFERHLFIVEAGVGLGGKNVEQASACSSENLVSNAKSPANCFAKYKNIVGLDDVNGVKDSFCLSIFLGGIRNVKNLNFSIRI